jgi:hypothetical protein
MEGTGFTAFPAFSPAYPRNPVMAEGEIIFQGVFRVESLQRLRYLNGRLPVLRFPFREAEASRNLCYMGIQGYYKLIPGDPLPYPEIDVFVPYHPAQKKVRPLAGTPADWGGKKLLQARWPYVLTIYCRGIAPEQLVDEPGQSFADVPVVFAVIPFENLHQRRIFLQGLMNYEKQAEDILILIEPVFYACETPGVLFWIESGQELEGAGAHFRKYFFQDGPEKAHPPVGKTGGYEPRDLYIGGRSIPVGEFDRIMPHPLLEIIIPVESFKDLLDVHRVNVLYQSDAAGFDASLYTPLT